MAQGARLSAAVMFVRNLDKSVSFYSQILGLEVSDRSSSAALLVNPEGAQLVLRAVGDRAALALGGLGVQYILWAVPSREDLDRCERELRQRSAYRETRTAGDVTTVEGRDPDDLVLMVAYASAGQPTAPQLSPRIYAW